METYSVQAQLKESFLHHGEVWKGHSSLYEKRQIPGTKPFLEIKGTDHPKRLDPYVLRHCFATHLLDNETDVRFIQELL